MAADLLPGVALALLGTIVPLLLAAAIALWVHCDARARGSEGVGWALLTLFVPPLALAYLVYRRRIGPRERPIEGTEATAATLTVGLASALVLAAALSPPDPISQQVYLLGTLPVGAVLGYWLFGREGYQRLRARIADARQSGAS